jgi:hypothetical protein
MEADMEGQAIESWGYEVFMGDKAEVRYVCDLCECNIPVDDLHRTAEHLHLCPFCHHHFVAIPEGVVKGSVLRFLMKNVL